MKKVLVFLLTCVLLAGAYGCSGEPDHTHTKVKRQKIDTFVMAFKSYVEGNHLTLENVGAYAQTFKDITPKNVFEETGCQIFKNPYSCESYLLYEKTVYELGIGFGGLGIVDAAACDFDQNGMKDLIYTYSWGSGMHRSCIGYFNLDSKSETQIDTASQVKGLIQDELIFEKISDTQFNIFTAYAAAKDGNFADLSLKKADLFGEITLAEGKPVFSIKK